MVNASLKVNFVAFACRIAYLKAIIIEKHSQTNIIYIKNHGKEMLLLQEPKGNKDKNFIKNGSKKL